VSRTVAHEFGGIAYRIDKPAAQNEWGYSGIEPTKEAFLAMLDGLVKALRRPPAEGRSGGAGEDQD